MKLARNVFTLIFIQIFSFAAGAKTNFVSSAAVKDLGLSMAVETSSSNSYCEAYGNFLYSSAQEDSVFNFYTPQLTAYDQGGSDYTKTRRYCSYKITLKHNSNLKVQFKNPYFKVGARALLPETAGQPTPTAKMDFSFNGKAAINSQIILDNILVGFSAFGDAKLEPIQGAPLSAPWTDCKSTQVEILLEIEVHAERLSAGNGTALAESERAQVEMEWRKCNDSEY